MAPKQICAAGQGYPRNQWYVAAWSSEVGRALFTRRLLGEPVVLYRTEDGVPVALADRCPHRGVPLSKGRIESDSVRCAYHGLVFGPDGHCREIPSQDSIPPQLRVRRFPLVEKWRWIWIWMGDPEKADPALIPDHHVIGVERPGYHAAQLYCMEIQANYTLMHENLLDTTHASFLHPGLLDDGELTQGEYRVEESPGVIKLVREMECRPGPAVARLFKVKEGYPYYRVLSTEAYLPGLNLARGTFADPALPDQPPRELTAAHGITPGGPRSFYVFHAIVTSYPEHWPPEAVEALRTVVTQDKDVLEAIQERYEDLDLQVEEYSVKSDQAGLRLRRRIAEMVELERHAR